MDTSYDNASYSPIFEMDPLTAEVDSTHPSPQPYSLDPPLPKGCGTATGASIATSGTYIEQTPLVSPLPQETACSMLPDLAKTVSTQLSAAQDTELDYNIQELYISHLRFRKTMCCLVLFFDKDRLHPLNWIARALFSAWQRKHTVVLERLRIREGPTSELTESFFHQMGISRPLDDDHSIEDFGGDDCCEKVELLGQFYTDAEDARLRFCAAFHALDKLARKRRHALVTRHSCSAHLSRFDVFTDWYKKNWQMSRFEDSETTLGLCPLECWSLKMLGEVTALALEHLDKNAGELEYTEALFGADRDRFHGYRISIVESQNNERILQSYLGLGSPSTLTARGTVLEAESKSWKCRASITQRIFGDGQTDQSLMRLSYDCLDVLLGRTSIETLT